MHTTSLLTTLLLAAIPTLAARPSIDFYSTSNCASGSGPTGSFGPIPTDVCQDLTGFHTGPAFGAKVTGPYPAGCTYTFYTNTDCNSTNFIANPTPNICFHIQNGLEIESVKLTGGNACI